MQPCARMMTRHHARFVALLSFGLTVTVLLMHLICVRSKADRTISHQRKWHRLAPCWLRSGLQLLEHQIKAQVVSEVCLRWSDWDYLWNLHVSVAQLCKLLFVISVMSINLLTSSLYGCTVAVLSAAQLWFLFYHYYFMTNSKMGCKNAAFNASFVHRRHGRMITL